MSEPNAPSPGEPASSVDEAHVDETSVDETPAEETVRMTPLLWALGIGATLLGIALGFILSAVSFRP